MFISEDRKREMKTASYSIKLIGIENEKELNIKTQPWTKIKEIKSRVAKEFNVGSQNIRIFYKNIEMIESLTILDYQLLDYKENIFFFKVSDPTKLQSAGSINVYGAFPTDKKTNKLIDSIRIGFLSGLVPVHNLDGTSGTYMLMNPSKQTVAIFKPIDEEAFTPNNPKGYPGKFGQTSFRKGILSGEGSIREVAASILDMEKGIFKVPETTFVEISHKAFTYNDLSMGVNVDLTSKSKIRKSIIHNFLLENIMLSNHKEEFSTHKPYSEENSSIESKLKNYSMNECFLRKKYGSLQKFVHKTEVAVNFCSDLFPTEEVHKIAVLDIRILNCDRNDENILVVK